MVSRTMLMKQEWFPRPHDIRYGYSHGLEHTTNQDLKQAVINPIAFSDNGLGAPSAYNANPKHASFTEVNMPNCFPESRLNVITTQLIFSLTKAAYETDKLIAVRCAYMPIYTSFDDIIAKDRVSTLDIGTILELQRESTDFQCYPLFNGLDVLGRNGLAVPTLHANVPGLTTDQKLEYVTFNHEDYYDHLQYSPISKKLMNCQGGIKWFTLTRNKPVAKINIFTRPKIKRMNDYSFHGVMTLVPPVSNDYQLCGAADTTIDSPHVGVSFHSRFNEWHQDFDMKRV